MNYDFQQKQLMQMTAEFQEMVDKYFAIQCRYSAAIREVQTKLENLDNEFSSMHRRNPIHHMESRLKSIHSIVEKLHRRDLDISIESATENLTDIAGIRVICSYIDDIYTIANLLARQDDVRVLRVRDYIKEPKSNGYRSLHLIVEIPVFLSSGKIPVPVEVQIRTIAMDFWASLEHSLRYKGLTDVPEDISRGLQEAAEESARLDEKMQQMHHRVEDLELLQARQETTRAERPSIDEIEAGPNTSSIE